MKNTMWLWCQALIHYGILVCPRTDSLGQSLIPNLYTLQSIPSSKCVCIVKCLGDGILQLSGKSLENLCCNVDLYFKMFMLYNVT